MNNILVVCDSEVINAISENIKLFNATLSSASRSRHYFINNKELNRTESIDALRGIAFSKIVVSGDRSAIISTKLQLDIINPTIGAAERAKRDEVVVYVEDLA